MIAIPERLGPYRILSLLGEGGMGVVYRAEHVDTGQPVAVKTTLVPWGSPIAGLRCEIHALTRLRHPGVVRIEGEGLEQGLPWYAMELLEGLTLEDYRLALWRGGPLPPWSSAAPAAARAAREVAAFAGEPRPDGEAETVALVRDQGVLETVRIDPPASRGAAALSASPPPPTRRRPAAAGRLVEVLGLVRRLCAPLAFLHGAGIVHRDLKPSNVFIRGSGAPVLMDFGLVSRAHDAAGREVIDESTEVAGTLNYMAPEQILGQIVDARADLYALGCILYELVTGMFPCSGANPLDFVRWHTQAKLTVPSALVDGVPTALDEIVVRLLAREARRRIGHADDLAKMLAALVADLTRGAPDRAPSGAPCAPAPGAEEPPAEIAASAYLYRPQLAGRDGVLEAFGERIALARQRAGSAVFVGGESGVGKTYLVTAVARDAALRHLAVVTGECQPVATAEAAGSDVRGAPLHPFRRLLQAIADRCREGGRGAADRILGPRGKILAAYEPTLRHLPGQDAYPDPPDVPAQAARRRILAALGGALAALAEERPLLFVIDDLQWADELSLDFLRSLDDSYFAGRPLLLVGTYRIEEVGDALREVLSAPARARVELGRLDERTVGAIIGDMLAMDCPPEPLVRALARRSGGNPFFVAEYLRAAVAERLLHREHGAWRFAEGEAGACDELPLPGSLRELVARRLDGLDPDARALVEAAAVLGREVDGDLLVAVAGMPQPAALPALKELLSRQVLEEVKDGTFRFVHDKLREIAYDRIPVPRRRALHLDGARALEARHRGAVSFSLLYSELAYHFTEAGELAEAIDYLEMAGLQAERSFANREAARAFAEALALDARNVRRVPPFRRAVWERRLGNAYLGLGKLVESQEALLRAVALLGHPVPVPTWRLVPAFLGQVAIQAAHRAREPEWRARPPSRREVLLEAARAYDLLVQASYYVTGDILRILHATLSNLNLAERAGPSPELALAYGNAHFTAGLIPWFSLARTYARRAHEILEGVTDPAIRSWVYVLAGAYATGVGDFDQAISLGQRAEAIAEEVGFRRRAEEALGVCGATYNLAGDFIQGRDTSHRIYESSLRGDPQTQVWGLSGVAMNCVALGEIDRAVDAAARSEKCLSQKLGRPEKIFCYGVLALTRLRAGDPEGALAAAESGAAAIAEGTPISFYAITAYSYVADVLLDLWERAGSLEPRRALERKARRSCDDVVASARIFPVHRPHAFLVRGRCAALTGDLPAARRLWQKSIASARELRMPYDEALAELALALSLPPTSPDRRPRLHRAAALFRQKSAAPDLARAEAALLG